MKHSFVRSFIHSTDLLKTADSLYNCEVMVVVIVNKFTELSILIIKYTLISHPCLGTVCRALTQDNGDYADACKAHPSKEPHYSKHDEGLRECTGHPK